MPTPAEEEAFTRSIVARFRDDGPRLVFADYLDDSPHPADRHRAEFIRLQLALARLPADHPHRGDLTERQNELLLRHIDEWTRLLRGLADGFEFRRGIVDSVTVSVGLLAARGEELFRKAAIRRVRIEDAGDHVSRLIRLPILGEVRELGLCGARMENGGLNVLLRSPHLGKVESLDLSFNGISDPGVRLLAECRNLPSLTALHLNDNGQITAAGMKWLAESPHLGELRVLDISANDVSDAGIAALAHSSCLARLHTLRVRNNHIGDAGCEAIAGSPLLARILAHDPRLDLRQNSINSAGLKALAACPLFAGVRVLDLSHNHIGDDGLLALANSPHAAKLSVLLLRQNPITDLGAVGLARSELMTRLSRVDLSDNSRLGRRGIDDLWTRRRDFRTVVECDGPPSIGGGPRQ
jgi:uncharacterized protein (TIGR02996 family)